MKVQYGSLLLNQENVLVPISTGLAMHDVYSSLINFEM